MTHTQPPTRASRRHRRALVSAGVAATLAAGGVVAVAQTAWWDCRFSTSTGKASFAYGLASAARSDTTARQIEAVPGVDSALGAAESKTDVDLVPGSDGNLIVSDDPYFSERDRFHYVSVNPVTAETSWSRGQAGQAAAPQVAGGSVFAFAAVADGLYRLTILDERDGSVDGCIDVERTGESGIGRAAIGLSPDGHIAVLATPTAGGSTISAWTTDDRKSVWTSPLPPTDGTVTWIGDTVVADRFDTLDAVDAGRSTWNKENERSRASITGLDPGSGEELWTWPQDVSNDVKPQSGSTVPFFAGPDDVVVVAAFEFDDDDASSRLLGLDPATGEEMWSVESGDVASTHGFGGTVLTLSDNVLTAIDAASGQRLWSAPVTGGYNGPRPDYAQPWGDSVIVATGDGIATIELATGDMIETPVQDAGQLRLVVTDRVLAVVKESDDSDTRELLMFSRDGT